MLKSRKKTHDVGVVCGEVDCDCSSDRSSVEAAFDVKKKEEIGSEN